MFTRDAVHARAVGHFHFRHRLSSRRPRAGFAMRSATPAAAEADRRPAAGPWELRVQGVQAAQVVQAVQQLRRWIVRRRRGERKVVSARGSTGSKGSRSSKGLVLCLVLFGAACSYLPAEQECLHASTHLGVVEGMRVQDIECAGGIFAGDGVKATLVFNEGGSLMFERLGFNSFGSTAVNIVVAEASGLVPRVATCNSVSAPNFHRESPLGHHFHPTLIDAKEAVSRYREVLEEVEFWPQCPQYWEVQDKRGENYRYCARKKGATEEPPRPENCRLVVRQHEIQRERRQNQQRGRDRSNQQALPQSAGDGARDLRARQVVLRQSS